jgi:hypothetical protein
MHQSGSLNDMNSLVEIASSRNGFACGIIPDHANYGALRFSLSAYHDVDTLFDFSIIVCHRNIKGMLLMKQIRFFHNIRI